jgi:hypothetical protein
MPPKAIFITRGARTKTNKKKADIDMTMNVNGWLSQGAAHMRHALQYAFTCALALSPTWIAFGPDALAQAVATTTVQGTVYRANGQPASGTLTLSWPAFSTASGQSVTADSVNVPIAPDGFVTVNLAPNLGATPAGLYYTAVYYLSDGTTNTLYWIVPAAAQATLAQVQAQVMPAARLCRPSRKRMWTKPSPTLPAACSPSMGEPSPPRSTSAATPPNPGKPPTNTTSMPPSPRPFPLPAAP